MTWPNALVVEIIYGTVVSALTIAFLALLRLIRDWGARRRMTLARAAEAESAARYRSALRDSVVLKLESGQQVPPDLLRDLLSEGLADAAGSESAI
jgi:hypothetical protein